MVSIYSLSLGAQRFIIDLGNSGGISELSAHLVVFIRNISGKRTLCCQVNYRNLYKKHFWCDFYHNSQRKVTMCGLIIEFDISSIRENLCLQTGSGAEWVSCDFLLTRGSWSGWKVEKTTCLHSSTQTVWTDPPRCSFNTDLTMLQNTGWVSRELTDIFVRPHPDFRSQRARNKACF